MTKYLSEEGDDDDALTTGRWGDNEEHDASDAAEVKLDATALTGRLGKRYPGALLLRLAGTQ